MCLQLYGPLARYIKLRVAHAPGIPAVFDCLTIGIIHETMVVHVTWVWTFFNNYSNHPRMCVLSTLCGNVDKHSPLDDYIYIYIYIYTRVIIQAQHEEDLMLKFTLFSVNCLQVQWPDYGVISYNYARKLIIHLLLDKMAAIFAKTFSNAFSWMKMTELRFKLYWNLFPGVQLTIRHHWFK